MASDVGEEGDKPLIMLGFLPGAKLLDGGPSDRKMVCMLKWHLPSDGFDEVGAD
jgi:hypothetical protein